MPSLSDTPSDVLYYVLVQFNELSDLHSAIRSCRSLLHTFNERRALILTRVFDRQIRPRATFFEPDPGCPSGPRRIHREIVPYRAAIDAVIARCKQRHPDDAITLQLCAWEIFLGMTTNAWQQFAFGESLVVNALALGHPALALTVAEVLWARMLAMSAMYVGTGLRMREKRNIQAFAQKLAIIYSDVGRYADAMRVFRQCYAAQYNLGGNNVFRALLEIYRKSRGSSNIHCSTSTSTSTSTNTNSTTAMESGTDTRTGASLDANSVTDPGNSNPTVAGDKFDLISLFTEQFTTSRHALLTGSSRIRRDDYNHDAERWLIKIQSELGRSLAAATTLQEALSFADQHSLNLMPLIGSSRTLIKHLEGVGQINDVLSIYKRVYDLMAARVGASITVSAYVAWAKEYAAKLRGANVGKKGEALEVDRQVWEALWQRSRRTRDGALIYNCRNAAWALHRAYQEAGRPQEAGQVMSAYEGLAESLSETAAVRRQGEVGRPANADAIMRARTLNLTS